MERIRSLGGFEIRNLRSRWGLLGGALLLTASIGCASNKTSRPPPNDVSTTTTTSATTARDRQEARVSNDETRIASDERELAGDRRRMASDARELGDLRARSGVERRASQRLDAVDAQVRALRAEIPRASAARKTKLENALADIDKEREDVERDIRRIPSTTARSFHTVSVEVNLKLDEIDRELRALRARSNR